MKGSFLTKLALCGITLISSAMAQNTSALSEQNRQLVTISSFTAKGDLPALKEAIGQGLDAGLSVNEIKEVLVQLYAYCGFPRSLNALNTLMTTIEERAASGKKDAQGASPGPRPEGSSLVFGTENQTKLCGAPVKGPLFDFAPAIDQYLKAHLFGDIFARDNISWKIRELVTIAALSTMKGTEGQLASHIRVGKHNGLTDAQVDAILAMTRELKHEDAFPLGKPADAKVFTGPAWVSRLVSNGKDYDIASYNVTFAPGVRNNWHSHSAGQILLCTVGTGYYQEKNKPARQLNPGDVVEIPANTEHWHGAAPDSMFVHLGITPKVSQNKTTWGGPVTDEEYGNATSPTVQNDQNNNTQRKQNDE